MVVLFSVADLDASSRIFMRSRWMKVVSSRTGVKVMFQFRQPAEVALAILVTFIAVSVQAKSIEQDDARHESARGILLDRLSPRHQQTWQAIKQIIYSKDANGRLLHPTLTALFEQLQTSEHSIFLEFEDSRSGCRNIAGTFSIERVDPAGARHVGVITLQLGNIEHASGRGRPNLGGGFVPLARLDKLDCYTEILAHEMAHAVDILFNPERVKTLDEILKTTEQTIRELPRRRRAGRIEPEMERAVQERDAFLHELEKPAKIAEAVVWRELIESQRKRKR